LFKNEDSTAAITKLIRIAKQRTRNICDINKNSVTLDLSLHFLLGFIHSVVFIRQRVDPLLQGVSVSLQFLLHVIMTIDRLLLIVKTLFALVQLQQQQKNILETNISLSRNATRTSK